MGRRWLGLIALVSLGCSARSGTDDPIDAQAKVEHIDRSGMADVGTDAALDYSDPALWLCRPGIDPNECHRDLDATLIYPDGTRVVEPHVRAENPEFDCFYVFPTVLLTGEAQLTDFSEAGVELTLDPLLAQAARFSRVCEVYAPLYRQVGLSLGAVASGANLELALQDVRDAFQYYLEHFNHGRKFVLLGHSQGSFLLTSLMRRDVDGVDDVRARMASAILLGAQPYVPPGERVGGSFANIPTCSEPGDTGCLIAYASFSNEAPPTSSALFGKQGPGFSIEPVDPDGQVVCTEPAHLAGHDGRYRGAYFPLHVYNKGLFATEIAPPADVDTPYVVFPDMFRGACRLNDGYSYLEVALDQPDGDTRTPPTYRSALLEQFGFGMHIVDYNIPLEDLIETAAQQAKALP